MPRGSLSHQPGRAGDVSKKLVDELYSMFTRLDKLKLDYTLGRIPSTEFKQAKEEIEGKIGKILSSTELSSLSLKELKEELRELEERLSILEELKDKMSHEEYRNAKSELLKLISVYKGIARLSEKSRSTREFLIRELEKRLKRGEISREAYEILIKKILADEGS